jgi:3-oxoacyl-[acyl-carrier-protein] synthase II
LNRAWITDATVVTALGSNQEQLWNRLLSGESGVRRIERFPTKSYQSAHAALVGDLTAAPGRSLIQALVDRLCNSLGPLPADCLLMTASTKGGVDGLERLARGEENDPRDLVFGTLVEGIATRLGLGRRTFNVNAACASSTIAVARAAGWIAAGRADAVLVCAMDVITEFVFSGFSSLKALSPGPCQPFDRDRAGLSLGDGAAALLLMSGKRLRREGRRALGAVSGWGVSNDATHITAPARDGAGLIRAVRQALAMAGIGPGDVAAISAHGTGTVYNDAMELTAFRSVFGERKVPIHSLKGALGHTMGAAGGIEVAVGLMALSQQVAPPTAGLRVVDPAALGLVSPEAETFSGDYLLTSNSGFGGVNAALVLQRGTPS